MAMASEAKKRAKVASRVQRQYYKKQSKSLGINVALESSKFDASAS